MHEILKRLPPKSIVLDLGSGGGSFEASSYPITVIRADLFCRSDPLMQFVACNAAALPFCAQQFDAVVLNHSLEHFENLQVCLAEIARVLSRNGMLYVAVPDATTASDRFYRWLARGGGHVNQFTTADEIVSLISSMTHLPHAGTKLLHTSLSFLNSKVRRGPPPRRLLLLGNGNETLLIVLNFFLRLIDRWFAQRLTVYGWAFYFGETLTPNTDTWTNICVRCGSAHSAPWLISIGCVKARTILPSVFVCPSCGARNYFTEP